MRRCSSASLGSGTAMNFFSRANSVGTSRKPLMTQLAGWVLASSLLSSARLGLAAFSAGRMGTINARDKTAPDRSFMTLLERKRKRRLYREAGGADGALH